MHLLRVGLAFLCLWLVGASGKVTRIFLHDLSYLSDFSPADAFEFAHTLSALAGLVNRQSPQLYLFFQPEDIVWLDYARTTPWLSSATLVNLTSPRDVFERFALNYSSGVVRYDPAVAATSNVASTVTGVASLLPVAFRNTSTSIYTLLVQEMGLPIVLDLVGMFPLKNTSGSAKCDAYLWAKETFIDTGLVDPAFMGFYVDYYWVTSAQAGKHNDPLGYSTITNHDYFVANKAFFWDLDVWGDETPTDDPSQKVGTDRNTLISVLQSANVKLQGRSMIHVGGFSPWKYKYSDKAHGGVATEWEASKLLTAFNAFVDADACCVGGMANAAFWQHYPLNEHYVQNPRPTPADLVAQGYIKQTTNGYQVVNRTYLAFYVGDYDSAAWVYTQLRHNWDDPHRGAVPLGWAINPNLAVRVPVVFSYLFATKSKNDFITTGDSGAGYVNPTQLFGPDRMPSNLPDATALWKEHNIPWYRQFDITFTGFLINGAAGRMTEAAQELYLEFSGDGMTDQTGYSPGATDPYLAGGRAPVFQEEDLQSDDPAQAADQILRRFTPGKLSFQVYRSVLKPASYHKQITDALSEHAGQSVAVVDPITLAYLSRLCLGGNNNDRVTYVSDTLPKTVSAGSKTTVSFSVRNNGWNTLLTGQSAPDSTRVRLVWTLGPNVGTALATTDMAPGQTVVFPSDVLVPVKPGAYALSYQLRRGGETSGDFDLLGNPAGQTIVAVH
eukprot:TRINITY_DN4389_c0_g1_i1.p1 TRINITY_DN4389_c0_g1~~TRINITY_DN4389_c0_g1_i1.p1  ORF type:complete len:733 (+),score=77.00 TRINITY_DN4389_c0_g1_i1:27-2201(+)